MPTQRQIEDAVGIDAEVAGYMMTAGTANANAAMDTLKLAVSSADHATMGVLTAAVAACRHEMRKQT